MVPRATGFDIELDYILTPSKAYFIHDIVCVSGINRAIKRTYTLYLNLKRTRARAHKLQWKGDGVSVCRLF